jgi:hypothetical protein
MRIWFARREELALKRAAWRVPALPVIRQCWPLTTPPGLKRLRRPSSSTLVAALLKE